MWTRAMKKCLLMDRNRGIQTRKLSSLVEIYESSFGEFGQIGCFCVVRASSESAVVFGSRIPL